jgi:hypothetical protein
MDMVCKLDSDRHKKTRPSQKQRKPALARRSFHRLFVRSVAVDFTGREIFRGRLLGI